MVGICCIKSNATGSLPIVGDSLRRPLEAIVPKNHFLIDSIHTMERSSVDDIAVVLPWEHLAFNQSVGKPASVDICYK
jgi:hypothetical protein